VDFEQVIKALEAYARAYVHYVLSFFGGMREVGANPDTGVIRPEPKLSDGSLIIFSFFSAAIGITLEGLFNSTSQFADATFPEKLIILVAYWLFLATFMHFVINLGKHDGSFSQVLSTVLQIVPVAYVVGTYIAFVAYCLVLSWAPGEEASRWAAAALVIAQLILLTLHLPRATRGVDGPGPGARLSATWGLIVLVGVIQTVLFLASLEASTKPAKEAPPPAKGAQGALAILAAVLLVAIGLPAAAYAAPTTAGIEVAENEGQILQRAGCGLAKVVPVRELKAMICPKSIAPPAPTAGPTASTSAPSRAMNLRDPFRVGLGVGPQAATLDIEDLLLVDTAAGYATSEQARRVYIEIDGGGAGGQDLAALLRVGGLIRDRLVAKGVEPSIVLFQISSQTATPAIRPYAVSVHMRP